MRKNLCERVVESYSRAVLKTTDSFCGIFNYSEGAYRLSDMTNRFFVKSIDPDSYWTHLASRKRPPIRFSFTNLRDRVRNIFSGLSREEVHELLREE